MKVEKKEKKKGKRDKAKGIRDLNTKTIQSRSNTISTSYRRRPVSRLRVEGIFGSISFDLTVTRSRGTTCCAPTTVTDLSDWRG
jgi:hypothetical protein